MVIVYVLHRSKKTGRFSANGVGTVNNFVARKGLPASRRDNGRDLLVRAMRSVRVAVGGLRHGLAVEPTPGGPAMPASARAMQRQWPETPPNQPAENKASASDPALVVPVIASPEEVLRARELREQLKKKYLDRPSQPCSPWCSGVD